ncbi:hypothetical protein [Micromonospora sp. CNB394]|uniref:hypothetical protein n=1 Tax=Micromonospora sp. CNB394 TaxID=1169151 RepID=UPI00035F96D0|nr:hypothetical protein [Micromonospora sp. CNB394]
MGADTAGAPAGSRYADQRPYMVADRLDDLRGPTPNLVLPPQVRHLWEARFPELASARRHAA